MRTRPGAGFTLAEVLVALAITGLVVLLAHELFSTVADAGRRVRHSRLALDREANGRRLLASAFLSLDVGEEEAGGFDGRPDAVQFSSWLPTQDGWHERRRLALAREESEWVARWEPGARVVLADRVEAVALDYLLGPETDAAWVSGWTSAVSAPLAVRVRLLRMGGRADTTLYLVKARG